MRPRTVQIYFPDGSPTSLRKAEITSSVCHALAFPRNKLAEARKRSEMQQPSVYFLFGENDEGSESVYIGEAEKSDARLTTHDSDKGSDFWNSAVVFYSTNDLLHKGTIKYLESVCIEESMRANRFQILNGQNSTKPKLSEAVIADLKVFYDDLRMLLGVLGFNVFQSLDESTQEPLIFCNGRGADARGRYTDEGLVVYAGSKGPIGETPSFPEVSKRIRNKLLAEKVLKEDGEHYLFIEDHIFSSPTAAAETVTGRAANGWTSWKDKEGSTLSDLKR